MPAAEDWERIERLCRSLAVVLIHRGTSREVIELGALVERSTDDWVRAFCRGRGDELPPLPSDPLVRHCLLARLLYAASASAVYGQLGIPLLREQEAATLEELLTTGWETTFREKWLKGDPDLSLN